jgi:hypothetical protein
MRSRSRRAWLRLASWTPSAAQHLARRDARAFVVASLEQNPGHARTHLDLTHAFELRRVLEHERQRAGRDVDDADLDGRRRRHRRRLAIATGDQDRRRQREKAGTAPRQAAIGLD